MNRTVYQPVTACGCRGGAQYPTGAADARKCDAAAARAEQMQTNGASCGALTQDCVLAMAYVHMQTLGELYDPCTALIAGTLFPSLDKPFCGATVSASAYPNPPARTCDCALPMRRDSGCGCGVRGGTAHG